MDSGMDWGHALYSLVPRVRSCSYVQTAVLCDLFLNGQRNLCDI